MTELKGKVCVVTGGAGPIVDHFTTLGGTVIPVDIVSTDQTNSLVCDQGDPASIATLERTIGERYGRIDVLVNNGALGGGRCAFHEKTLEEYDDVMRVNARGPLLLAQAAIRLHLATEGDLSIINIASMAGNLGMPEAVVYVMSKHALIGLTKTIAVEYATRRVRCNSVSPGVMEVPNIQGFDSKDFQALMASTPMGRGGTPQEVASMCAYLASDASGFVTGADFKIDGGRMAC